jgi:hypothetical protein
MKTIVLQMRRERGDTRPTERTRVTIFQPSLDTVGMEAMVASRKHRQLLTPIHAA